MIITLAAAGLTSTLLVLDAIRQPAPDPETLDLVRQARELTVLSGNAIWPGFAEAPDSVLLIDGETEFLLCHEGPAAGFSDPVAEPVTGCTLRHRDRQFPPALLASFPAVDGVPTIVVGTPETTGLAPQDWMRTLLHEHFHQWETAPADSYQRAMDLDLHDGDQTGMWMLNYPFPYDDAGHATRFTIMVDRAVFALENRTSAGFSGAAQSYLNARRAFLDALTPKDAAYYEFQVRKEGVARWTELAIPRQLASQAPATAELARMAETQDARLLSALNQADLNTQRRVAFYALGAAEAEMLDILEPDWKLAFLDGPLALAPHFETAINVDTRRQSDGRQVWSDTAPIASITIEENLDFAGRLDFDLFGVADVQRFHFLQANDTGQIERLLVVQFEQYQDTNDHTYPTEADQEVPVTLAGFDFRTGASLRDIGATLERWGGRGLEYEFSDLYLRSRGYQMDDPHLVRSWTHIVPGQREELIFLYYEPLNRSGLDFAQIGLTADQLRQALSVRFPAVLFSENGIASRPDLNAGLQSFLERGAASFTLNPAESPAAASD